MPENIDLHEDTRALLAELKAERVEAKAKEQREAWIKYTSMTLVFIAVLAAIASQRSGGYSSRVLQQLNRATLAQAQASDQWSFFQAKSVKQHLAELELEQALRSGPTNDPAVARQVATARANVARYDQEKAAVKTAAEALEGRREDALRQADSASAHSGSMGLAVTLFQIAIAVGSICLVTKKRPLWFAALVLAAVAVVRMLLVW